MQTGNKKPRLLLYMKSSISALILTIVVMCSPALALAQYYDGGFMGYGGGGDSFLFPNAGNAPRAELYVHSWGPTTPTQQGFGMGTYRPAYTAHAMQYPAQYAYAAPMYSHQSYINNFQLQQFTPTQQYAPYNYAGGQMPYTYAQPNYVNYANPTYSYTPSYSYGYDTYSYGGGYYPQPAGTKDFWGNPMCNWGSDYGNFPCDRDPHQWVQDPYTGSWY